MQCNDDNNLRFKIRFRGNDEESKVNENRINYFKSTENRL